MKVILRNIGSSFLIGFVSYFVIDMFYPSYTYYEITDYRLLPTTDVTPIKDINFLNKPVLYVAIALFLIIFSIRMIEVGRVLKGNK